MIGQAVGKCDHDADVGVVGFSGAEWSQKVDVDRFASILTEMDWRGMDSRQEAAFLVFPVT
jgi:hypothetical protein